MFSAKKWLTAVAALTMFGCGPQGLDEGAAPEASKASEGKSAEALTAAPPMLYAGLYRAGTGGYYLWAGVEYAAFTTKNQELYNSGLRLSDLNVHTDDDGVTRYDGVWNPGTGNQVVSTNLTYAALAAQRSSLALQGLRLVNVETYVSAGQTRFVAVFRPGTDATGLYAGTWSNFVANWTASSNSGLRLVDIETYLENGERKWLGVYRAGTGGYGLYAGVSYSDFVANVAQAKAQGLRLVDFNIYWENNAWRYTGVYKAGTDAQQIVLGQSWADFNATWSSYSGGGLRLVGMQSYQAPSWSRALGQVYENQAVGYSYAVVEGGAITGSGGVGYARAPWESALPGLPMTASTRVHLASVSKPVTAAALLSLTQRYPSVKVDNKFYPYLQSRFPSRAAGVENITLRELLTHKSGMAEWGYCGDNFTLSMAQLLNTPLTGTPGVTEQYSNGNFCLVRAVIEAVSGMSYVSYVKTYVLAPMGITDMSCTPDLTLYYKKGVHNAGYFWNNDYTSQCAAYGWYASATDMAKFLTGIRNNTVLTPATTAIMNNGLLGWWGASTAGGTAYHHNGAWVTGDGRGSNTGIIRLPNGVEAVVLSNTDGFDTIGSLLSAYQAGPYAD